VTIMVNEADNDVARWREQLATLSSRERDALVLAASGLRSTDIGTRLGISEATVKSHLHRVYLKLNVKNRVEATAMYLRASQGGNQR